VAEKARGAAVPELAWRCIRLIIAQFEEAHVRITEVEQKILVWQRTNELSQRLETIPGVGVITASALVATITDPISFRSGRPWQLGSALGIISKGVGRANSYEGMKACRTACTETAYCLYLPKPARSGQGPAMFLSAVRGRMI
jgi:transposase